MSYYLSLICAVHQLNIIGGFYSAARTLAMTLDYSKKLKKLTNIKLSLRQWGGKLSLVGMSEGANLGLLLFLVLYWMKK